MNIHHVIRRNRNLSAALFIFTLLGLHLLMGHPAAAIDNTPPAISLISDVTVNEDTPTGPIAFTITDLETTADQLSLSVDSSNPALVPPLNVMLGGISDTRSLTVTPAANQSGSAVISITVSDGLSNTLEPFTVTVTAINDPPTITAIADLSTNEDTSTGPITFTVNDVDGPSLTLSAVSGNSSVVSMGNISFGTSGPNRTVTVVPTANQSGIVPITVTVSDGSNLARTTFTLTVNAVNDPPTISTINDKNTPEDTPLGPITFSVNDIDSPSLTVIGTSSVQSRVADASITISPATGGSGNRTFTLVPVADATGLTRITLTVSDGSLSDLEDFNLTINAVNDRPTISPINDQTTPEDTPFGPITFSVNDIDSPSLTVTGISANQSRVADASITISPAIGGNGNRTVSIVPVANASGTARITLTVTDNSLSSVSAFNLNVTAVNDPPTLSAIAAQTLNESSSSSAIPFTVSDVDNSAGSLDATVASSNPGLIQPAGLVLGGSGSNRTLTITPVPLQNGQAVVTVTVSDGSNLVSRSVAVTVVGVDNPPTLSAMANQNILEDQVLGPITFVISDVDTPISTLISHLSVTGNNALLVAPSGIALAGSGGTRSLTITPVADASGSTQINLSVSDDTSTASRSFTLNVAALNDGPKIDPIISPQLGPGIAEDSSFTANIQVSDIDSANLSVSAESSNQALVNTAGISINPATGTSTARQLVVTPLPDANGITLITVTVSDGQLTDSTVFHLKVNAVNDAPTINSPGSPGPQTIAEDGMAGPIAVTVDDVDSAVAGLQVTVSTSNPALLPLSRIVLGGSGANRTIALTPLPDASGSSQIVLTVSDGTATATSTFAFTVTPVNDPPVISAISSQEILLGGSAVFPFTVTDVDDAYAALQVLGESSNPLVVPSFGPQFQFSPITPPNRLVGMNTSLTLVPNPVLGSSQITVRVSDGKADAASSFNIFVVNESTPPTIAAIADQVIDENTVLGPLQISVNDDRVPAGELKVSVSSSNATLVPNTAASLNLTNLGGTTRTLVITPTANQSGDTVITLLVSDGVNAASTSFKLTVNAVDAPPSVTPVNTSALTSSLVAGTASAPLSFQVSDQDTDAANLSITAVSSDPTVVPVSNIVISGTGANRTVQVTPSPGQAGLVVITLHISDGTTTVTTSFTVNVIARLSLPALMNNFSQCSSALTDCSEPNNSLQTAFGPLRTNTLYTGTVDSTSSLDRFDFYSMTLQSGMLYTVSLTFAGGDLDLFLYGTAPDYKLLTSSNFQGIARPEQLVYRAGFSGVHYILVYGFDTAGQRRAYNLLIQSQP